MGAHAIQRCTARSQVSGGQSRLGDIRRSPLPADDPGLGMNRPPPRRCLTSVRWNVWCASRRPTPSVPAPPGSAGFLFGGSTGHGGQRRDGLAVTARTPRPPAVAIAPRSGEALPRHRFISHNYRSHLTQALSSSDFDVPVQEPFTRRLPVWDRGWEVLWPGPLPRACDISEGFSPRSGRRD